MRGAHYQQQWHGGEAAGLGGNMAAMLQQQQQQQFMQQRRLQQQVWFCLRSDRLLKMRIFVLSDSQPRLFIQFGDSAGTITRIVYRQRVSGSACFHAMTRVSEITWPCAPHFLGSVA